MLGQARRAGLAPASVTQIAADVPRFSVGTTRDAPLERTIRDHIVAKMILPGLSVVNGLPIGWEELSFSPSFVLAATTFTRSGRKRGELAFQRQVWHNQSGAGGAVDAAAAVSGAVGVVGIGHLLVPALARVRQGALGVVQPGQRPSTVGVSNVRVVINAELMSGSATNSDTCRSRPSARRHRHKCHRCT